MTTTLAEPSRVARAAAAPPSAASAVAPRLYYLDNLRAAVIALVVLLHGSMTYMAYAAAWWYVVDPQSSLAFTMLVLVVDVPIMPAMFFVAGYFALPSLQKRGPGRFLRDKALRVGLPWALGVIFLAPLTAYMIYFSRHVPMSYLQFWATDFWGKMYQQSVYWFLGILMALFALLALAYGQNPRRYGTRTVEPDGRLTVWLFGAVITAAFLVISRFFPIDAWSHNYLFVYQPVRVPLYIGYFALGVTAQQHGWFTPAGYNPNLGAWGMTAFMSGVAYLGCRMTGAPEPAAAFILAIVTGVLFNLFCLSAIIAGVTVFQQKVNGAGRFWRSQAANSYGIYYVHPLILYPLAYLLVAVPLPIGVKAVVLIVATLLLAWGVSALVLKRAPLLSEMF